MNFYDANHQYFYHLFASLAVFVITYFIVSKKHLLYASAGLLILNILAAIIPMASNAITGSGISESTIYHLIKGGEKFSIIFEYKEINYLIVCFFTFAILLYVFCRKIKIHQR